MAKAKALKRFLERCRVEAQTVRLKFKSMPPDPEEQNFERSEWAKEALAAFVNETGCEYDSAVYDLLCDLRHFCDRHGLDFEQQLRMANDHYRQETSEALDEGDEA